MQGGTMYITQTLLFGNQELSEAIDKQIINIVHDYISIVTEAFIDDNQRKILIIL